MRTRPLVVLAVLAALLGAPSFASAAGNSLSAPSVTPASGTVTTVFTLRVAYDGKFPATLVTVSVAGLPLPMTQISGTPEEGTWSVSTLLPAGTWTPTFTSSSLRGNAATLVGPAISVVGPLATPTPRPTVSGPSPRSGEIDTGDPGDPIDPADTADPETAPVEGQTETEPSVAPDPVAPTASDPSSGGGGDDGGGETSLPAAPTGPAGPSDAGSGDGEDAPAPAPADAPRAEGSAEPGAMPASDAARDDEPATGFADDGLLNAVLLIGLSGVAAVAVIGTALLILGRRRATAEGEAPIPVLERSDTDALLARRAVRQAKVRLSEDPIVAAMGVDEQVAARRQRRNASQVASGPGERPTRRRH